MPQPPFPYSAFSKKKKSSSLALLPEISFQNQRKIARYYYFFKRGHQNSEWLVRELTGRFVRKAAVSDRKRRDGNRGLPLRKMIYDTK